MTLAAALLPLLPDGKGVIAFVGAGGKTSAMFRLASALDALGRGVLLTSTTHLLDPRLEEDRPPLALLLRPELEGPVRTLAQALPLPQLRSGLNPGLTLLMTRPAEAGKLKGLHPSWILPLRHSWDLILVEADGSRGLPLKAPGGDEPELPPATDLVVGVLGLDGLDRPMDGRSVHRPERFSAITGCAPGALITWTHLQALVSHPEGLFKGAQGRRVLLLNKADAATAQPTRAQLAGLAVDLTLLGSRERVMVMERGMS